MPHPCGSEFTIGAQRSHMISSGTCPGPGVIVGAAFTAALYKRQTKAVERNNSDALSRMSSVASQAFSGIRTVR